LDKTALNQSTNDDNLERKKEIKNRQRKSGRHNPLAREGEDDNDHEQLKFYILGELIYLKYSIAKEVKAVQIAL
jgi:hypothetical protein